MKMKVRWCSVVSFCLSIYAVCSSKAATVMVTVQDFAFQPQIVTVNVGDEVMWMNNDVVGHTTTADNGSWNGDLPAGGTFSRTFTVSGNFGYHCAPHPFMTGTVEVQDPTTTPPTVFIQSPANNATFAAPGPVNILASASSPANGGRITKVEFFDGTILIATDTTSPFIVTNTMSAGQHTLTAKATDNFNSATVSAPVNITVNGGGTAITDPIPEKIQKGSATIELQTVVTGLISPLGIATADDGRLFVYDQVGLIHIITNGVKLAEPLLDVRNRLVNLSTNYDERGLLGVALHPGFAQNGKVYTYTSEPVGPMADFMVMEITNNHQSVVAEWTIDPASTNRLDPNSRREVLRIDEPQSNHNGGTMRFGPDGLLYISLGDGGAADDQGAGHSEGGNGQDKTKALGKVIRIDVNARTSPNGQYGIPSDNPFVNEPGAVKEIFAMGFRNPYSFSFDKQNGDLWLGDVGQNNVEEVDRVIKGANYGWPIKEGTFYFDPNGTGNGFVTTQPVRAVPAGLMDPLTQFDHDEGFAVIGGYVYRGAANTNLFGKYVFGDWGKFAAAAGRLFYFDGTALKEFRIGFNDRPLGGWLKGIGQDQAGELYVFTATDLGPTGTSGKMSKIVPATFSISEVARQGTDLLIKWNGGVGPFVLEMKTNLLSTAQWTEVKTTSETNTTVAIQGDAAFFRVRAQ